MTSSQPILIYYFSGTGNALSVANWIQRIALKRDQKCQIINIASSETDKQLIPPKGAMIGFISPTHGFNFPPIMLHFIFRFPRADQNPVFIINTRGGLKLSKYFIPGLSGLAQYFTALLLWFKGYKIQGMHPIDLPSNWISLHPGVKEKVVKSIYERRKEQTEIFAHKLVTGKRDLRALRDIIQDLLISPIGILYYFLGRFFLAKTFVASASCDNCELCIKNCPVKAIKLIDERPFWTYKCESCMQCVNQCPKQAIETAHGFAIAITTLINSVILFKFYRWIEFPDWYFNSLYGSLASTILDSVIFLIFFFISYRIMHFLKRYKPIERLITYTSFTKFPFWRKYRVKKMKFWKAYKFKNT